MPGQKRNVGYFVNWGIYARSYRPQNVPAASLTHMLYAFANVKSDSGEVYLSDPWADEQIHWEGDSWDEPGNNLYGGWTYSSNFAPMASKAKMRQKFADSAVKIVEDYGIDGLDIDWEYPQNDRQAKDYVELLKVTRQALDKLAKSKDEESHSYELTIAAPCGPSNFEQLRVGEMDPYLSFWNLMAYDYSGSWDSVTGNQANAFGEANHLSTARAIDFFHKKRGVAKDKLVIGIPLYGRSFTNTEDGPGHPYQGVGPGSWEQGTYDYKALPLPGAGIKTDSHILASWCYSPANREFVTYDTKEIALAKARWINGEGYGGAMYWELSGDYDQNHPQAIVPGVALVLAQSGGLHGTPNHLSYPDSKWDNLKNGTI